MFFNDLLPSSEKAELAEQQVEMVSLQTGSVLAATNGGLTENTINVLLNFQIKEVQTLQILWEVWFRLFFCCKIQWDCFDAVVFQLLKFDQDSFVLIDSALIKWRHSADQPAGVLFIWFCFLFPDFSSRCCWPWRSPKNWRSHHSSSFTSLTWGSTLKSGSTTCVPQRTSTRSPWSAWSSKVRAVSQSGYFF